MCQELLKSTAQQKWGSCGSMPPQTQSGASLGMCSKQIHLRPHETNSVNQTQHSHEHKQHQRPHSVLCQSPSLEKISVCRYVWYRLGLLGSSPWITSLPFSPFTDTHTSCYLSQCPNSTISPVPPISKFSMCLTPSYTQLPQVSVTLPYSPASLALYLPLMTLPYTITLAPVVGAIDMRTSKIKICSWWCHTLFCSGMLQINT